jgi:hypothetical protein
MLAQRQPGSDSFHGLVSQVNAGPTRALADQELRLGTFTLTDFEQILASHVQRSYAPWQVPLVLVSELIIVCEEIVVVAVKAVAKPADLRVTARMPLPEFSDRLLIHGHSLNSYRKDSAARGCLHGASIVMSGR